MATTAFDTLAVTRQLKAKGFNSDQAEAITDAVRASVTDGTATKADIAELRTGTTAAIAELRTDMRWVKWGGAILGGFVLKMLWDINADMATIMTTLTVLDTSLTSLISGG